MEEIIIYLDCKLKMRFYDNMEKWDTKEYINFPVESLQINLETTLKSTKKLKTKKLKAFGRLHIRTPRKLIIFCYEFINPTKKQLDVHVWMFRLFGAEEFENTDFTKNTKPEHMEGLTCNERSKAT